MEQTPVLIHILPSNRWGGVERYALDICRHFNSNGWQVFAMTRDAKAVDTLFEKAGIPLLHAPLGGMTDFTTLSQLRKCLKQFRDKKVILHVHGFRTAFTALLARKLSRHTKVKVIMTRHKVKRGRDTYLFRRIYRNLDALIFVSEVARNRFLSSWQEKPLPFDPTRLHTLHNSLNLQLEEPEPKNGKGPVSAMFHGPLKPGKGLETLIDALALLKGNRMRMKIIGSGKPDYVDSLRRRAINRGVMDSIDWHRHSDNPLALIREADFGVLPSQAEEAFGLANLEYMAMGKPQVCTSNGAQPEYITDGREGFLVSPGNSTALANAMKKLASDPELRIRMGKNAYKTFTQKHTWYDFISSIMKFYLL